MRYGRVVAAVLVVVLWASGCSSRGRGNSQLATQLSESFSTAARNNRPVDLGRIVGGDWDHAVFVCPYEDATDVAERLGFEWSEFPGPNDSEGRALFLFTKKNEVVTWTEMSRQTGDPCTELPRVLQREEATVEVRVDDVTGDGSRFHVLEPPS